MTEQAKTESTSLVVIQPTDIRAFFVESKNLDSVLAEIETLASNFTPDVTTAKGRKLIGSQAYSVARTKTFIDSLGKELVDAEKEIPKRIDATRKRVRDFCDELQARIRQPLTDFENAEKARVAALEKRLEDLRSIAQQLEVMSAYQPGTDVITRWIGTLDEISIDDSWEEYKERAQVAKDAGLVELRKAHEVAKEREAQQAEIERLKAEQAKRDQEERERQIAEQARHEAEQKALREKLEAEQREQAAKDAQAKAEQDAKDAQERLIREQKESAERERLAAEQAAERERQRIAQEEANRKAEEERRAANVEHQRTYNREVIADMKQALSNLSDEDAITLLTAIVKHKVRHISIQY